MTTLTHQFGPYEITILRDGLFEPGTEVVAHLKGAEAREKAVARWGRPKLALDVNTFLLRGPNGLTLVDTGAGTNWGPALGQLYPALEALGIKPEDIDQVLLTHLHGDHALGLIKDGKPWLSRAAIHVPAADLAYFTDAAAKAATPEARRSGFDITERLIGLYGDRLKPEAWGEVMPGIELRSLPGHTPGQGGYLVKGAPSLLISADVLHLPSLQGDDQEVGTVYDLDPQLAFQTRRALLEEVAREGWLLAGGHMRGFEKVTPKGAGFELTPI
ncbi:MBL fold metallo-hydrolase [Acetobacteraceae bacterium H6797]|nr:MBL fold metallo-hydrolase [Acetobacteraceae bacterium H6797]